MNGWDLPEIQCARGPIVFPRAGGLIAAGGWCAPSEHLYKINEPMTDKEARAYYYKLYNRANKRAMKAERKLRKLRKLIKEIS